MKQLTEQEAADQALANVMLEGFVPDTEFMEVWNKHIRGEISEEEYLAIMLERALEKDGQELTRQTKQRIAA